MTHLELNRRSFVVATAAAAGGMILGVGAARAAAINATPWMSPTDKEGAEVSHWVVIDPEGFVTFRQAKQEMGQGTFTALPMILAEEMHVDWSMVRVEYADVNRHVRNDDLWGSMGTFGSGGTRRSRVMLQEAGASVRERLKAAAATAWGVDPAQVSAKDSILSSGNNQGTFAEFASAAAQITLAEEPAIKTPDQFQFIGTSVARLDTPLKVNGSAKYGIDTRLPGMLYAAIRFSPVPWGELDDFEADAVLERPGVVQVVELERDGGTSSSSMRSGIAVVADSWYRAKTAVDLIPTIWENGAAVHVSNEGMFARGSTMLDRNGEIRRNDGDALGIINSAANVIRSDYQRPYDAHARMEPSNATVSIAENRVDVFVSSQNPPSNHGLVAGMTGYDPNDVYTHNHFLGGGYGGSGPITLAIRHATQIAMEVGQPVKTVLSREEDLMQNAHRPMGMAKFAAVVGDDGLPAAWFNRTYGSDSRISDLPYQIANVYSERHGVESHITTTAHRAPGSGVNGFMIESFVDEVAQAGGWDPLEWRIELTKDQADYQLVLNTLKQTSGFRTDLPRGEGMGVAIIESHGTICAMCATVTVSRRGQLRVEKIVTVLDSGHVVHPLTCTMQAEGCIAFELSHAWVGGQNWQAGQLVNNNFDKYNLLRIEAMPEVEVHLALSGGDKWGGMGEPGVPPVGGAVANAIYYATGKRIYSTPFVNHDLSWS